MQGTESAAVLMPTSRAALASDPWCEGHDPEPAAFSATLVAPPLRYEVESLQHWIDLNA